MNLALFLTTNTLGASQPISKTIPIFLDSSNYIKRIDFTKQIKSIAQGLSYFGPFDRIFNSPRDESSQMMKNTYPSNIPTNTQKVLKPFLIYPYT
jgi:hypothetical protein